MKLKIKGAFLLLVSSIIIIAGCSTIEKSEENNIENNHASETESNSNEDNDAVDEVEEKKMEDEPEENNDVGNDNEEQLVEVDTNPESVTVLVNQEFGLPDHFVPEDLVYPDVRFIFDEKIEKRMMRQEAAEALEKLFSAAKEDGITLIGVSAYRSYNTQSILFNGYVERDGEEVARTYSAVPGYSEHQTGLTIDVTGGDMSCVVEDCFADTEEAKWLEENAADYGYIIRYPEGKQDITGYKYEPWHIRYVGVEMAKEIAELGVTLEEHMNAVPVSN